MNARRRLAFSWVVFPIVIATVVVIGFALKFWVS